jgi:hypothetical protein
MREKNLFRSFWFLLFLAIFVVGAPVEAAELLPSQEAALFSHADLGPVDTSPKRVTVEVYVSPHPELNSFHRLVPQAWPGVYTFYARMGVLLEMVPGLPEPGTLEPRKRLRFEALNHKEWMSRTCKAFQVAPLFRSRFMAFCQNKYAFAHPHLSTIQLDFDRFQNDILSDRPGETKTNPERLTNLIIHELGHLFGLYHAHEFVNDPVQDFLPDGETPNFMSHFLTEPRGLGFVEFQKRQVHSYLSGGKVFQQFRQVDFDPLRYLELVKLHNNYQEPKSKKE